MAKRKRLSPANPVFLSEPLARPTSAPPIADVAREVSAHAALEEMAQTLSTARAEGRLVIDLPLADIDLGYLVRDRLAADDEEMQALIDSLRVRGQQTPIEVAPLDGDRYGLISGWRRCRALSQLYGETQEARFATVQALVRQPDQSADAYLAMVEENEIRVGLSFYERAHIAAKTVETRVYSSPKDALQGLFSSASRAKRSKIKSFMTIVEALDGVLRFPHAIGERLGLRLAKALEEDAGFAARLKVALVKAEPVSAEAEQVVIVQALQPQSPPARPVSHTKQVAPGVIFTSGQNSVTLKGAALTEDFQNRLIKWLQSEL